MKRSWSFTIFTLLLVLLFAAGCAKKTVLKEEGAPRESAVAATPVVKTPDKSAAAGEAARKRAEAERAGKEKSLKAPAARESTAGKEATKAPAKDIYEMTDIHFDFDKSTLRDEVRATLNKHAEWLKKNEKATVTVEGHCDERGTAEYNLALGERRADAAAKYLTDMGVDAKRIKTLSYSFERPLDPRHNEEAWAKNRRGRFAVSGK